jgi:hypothetical protein
MWNNNIVLFFGTKGGIGFRVDLDYSPIESRSYIYDGTTSTLFDDTTSSKGNISAAFTIGSSISERTSFMVQLGYKADETEETLVGGNKQTSTGNGVIGFKGGLDFSLGETGSLYVELALTSQKGITIDGPTFSSGSDTFTFAGELYAHYRWSAKFGESATVKFQPSFAFGGDSGQRNIESNFKVGGEYKFQTLPLALYTNVGLRLFKYADFYHEVVGQNDVLDESGFDAIFWSTNTLDLGLTFEPSEGLFFGAGVKAALGELGWDFANMSFETGTNAGVNMWNKSEVYFSISYKF